MARDRRGLAAGIGRSGCRRQGDCFERIEEGVTEMATTNHERVGKALALLSDGLSRVCGT